MTLVDAARRRTPAAWLTIVAPLASLFATLLRPDLLPAVPHVDQILWTSLADQPLAALAVWAGTLLLFAPSLGLWRRGQSAEAAGFAALWAVLVVSALLANYPTPLVGYGASCILGYLLAALADTGGSPVRRADRASATSSTPDGDVPADWRIASSTL